jgi:hypothetical protein
LRWLPSAGPDLEQQPLIGLDQALVCLFVLLDIGPRKAEF